MTRLKLYKTILPFLILLLYSFNIYAQKTSEINNKIYAKITLGAGLGSGLPQQINAIGICGLGEFNINKNRDFINIGTRGLQEFEIVSNSNVTNSASTIEITYGRLFQNDKFAFTTNIGLSYITFVEKGALLPRNTGFQVFTTYNYEKINYYTVGIPISVKLFFNSIKKRGWLIEPYLNVNTKIPFGGINIANQFIVFKTKNNNKKVQL